MKTVCARTACVFLICLGILSNVALAEFKSFGVYQDTETNGVLDIGDTFLGGFENWYTHFSAATSYNYGDHYVEENDYPDPLNGFTDLTGAPYAADENENVTSWLPISNPDLSDDDVLHIYMVWSGHDNAPEQSGLNIDGFSLGILANSFIRSRSVNESGGEVDLDIAIRNDGTAFPQVTLSDDYIEEGGDITGRPPAPGTLDPLAQEQEYYKIADPGGEPYNHYFEGRWEYTKSTTDGGVISGIHNGDYDIDINPSDIVTSISGDGLVIRINPQLLDEIDKIIVYDFGYAAGANQVTPVELEIPLVGIDPERTLFIASIPEVVPEPSSLLSLLVIGTTVVLGRRGRKRLI